jgi:hypothetical protein
MDAPTYPPAIAFEQPAYAPYVLRLEDVSLAELMKVPAAWDIVLKHLPGLKMMTGSSMMKPYLGNFAVHDVQHFIKTATPEVIAAIDAELAGLPPVEATP